MDIALAAAISLASGYLLVAFGWPRSKTSLSAWLMKLSLAAGFGVGISSIAFFLSRMVRGTHFVVFDLLSLALTCTLYFLVRLRAPATAPSCSGITDFDLPSWLGRILIAAFAFAVLAAIYSSTMRAIVHPHGDGWDAFAIWNLHARFLFLGGPQWRDGFNAIIPWSHPDYPLLLPAATARLWSYHGHDAPWVPAIVGLVFTFSTCLLLVSSLTQLRGPNAALLGGIALMSTPFFIEQGAAQYADVPLSFFILATIVLLHFGFHFEPETHWRRLSGSWILAGVSAGFAAWTKNEGLLFLVAMFFVLCMLRIRKESEKSSEKLPQHKRDVLTPAVLGATPILAVIAWFKYSVATSGDLLSAPDVMIHKILTPSRYGIILRWYAKEFLRFGDWWVVPGTVLLVAFYFLARSKNVSEKGPILRASIATLVVTLAGDFVIYLITPRDLYWHLRFSLNRLFLQLWPTDYLPVLPIGRA